MALAIVGKLPELADKVFVFPELADMVFVFQGTYPELADKALVFLDMLLGLVGKV